MAISYFLLSAAFSIFLLTSILSVEAASNPNLDVSAENSEFNNHFAGSMVVEVVIRDNDIRDTDEGKGEPDVTLNGKSLRMIQATDGNWYAYFANDDAAKTADAVAMTGEPGQSLDFGVFCDRDVLSSLGFENNGELAIDLNSIIELKSNSDQDDESVVVDGGTNSFPKIVTFVENGPNSGIFESFDSNDESTIRILSNVPRDNAGSIEYNEESVSILTGFSTASVSLQKPELKITSSSQAIRPGIQVPIVLIDSDQNTNSGAKDDLDASSGISLIPTLKIGNPVTLKDSSNVKFYLNSIDSLSSGTTATSSIRDGNSERLFIDTAPLNINSFEKIALTLGISSSQIRSVLIDNSDNLGTNWLNYDLRSFQRDFDLNDFTDTEIIMYFGTLSDSSPSIVLVKKGEISSPQGFLKIDQSIIDDIFNQNGSIFLVINFDSSNDDPSVDVGNMPSLINTQPIIFDLFSFGLENDGDGINNSIYRFELEETSDNSSTFEGEFEFAFFNQLNILDDDFISSIKTISDDIKFVLTDRLIDEDAIFISYSDLDRVGLTTTVSSNSGKSNLDTNSATLSSNSNSYRFGQPVTITLNDPDLNLRNDLIDVYFVINDPNSENVDTVGKNDVILLEILIKDIRYKRCTIDGVEHGGLGSTGFTLIETGPSSGIFEGVFKMPSKICNASGTKLISPAGGSIDAKYYDSRDSSGNPSIVSLLKNRSFTPTSGSSFALPQLSAYEIVKPTEKIREIVLSGTIDNHRRGIPLGVLITFPDGQSQNFAANLSNNGNYRSLISINSDSLTGRYDIHLSYNGAFVGSTSFQILNPEIPAWVKNNANSWSSSSLTDSEFANNLEYLIEQGIIDVSSKERFSVSEKTIPAWVKNNAKWWYANQISDEDFIKSVQYLVKKGIIGV